jgi:hypothetical protein
MKPPCPSARSTVARFRPDIRRPDIRRPHLAALLMLVVTALVVTLGARFTAPDATAATTDKTFETDDHVITQTPDGTVTIIDKKTQIAIQDTIDPATTGPTEKELATQADGLSHQFRNNLGWDLETDADRTRLLNETRALTQQLHNIPQATLNLTENAGIHTLRDIVDELNIVAGMDLVAEMDDPKNCRERCLIRHTAPIMLLGTGVAFNLRLLKNRMAKESSLYAADVVASITVITGLLLIFWSALDRDLRRMPVAIRLLARIAMIGLVGNVYKAWTEVIDYVAHSRATMRQAVTDAAQHLDTLTPDDEPATDYDLAKDEL